MKKLNITIKSLAVLIAISLLFAFKNYYGESQSNPEHLLDPAKLAAILNDAKASKPAIFNVGPMSNIKGAVYIGSTSASSGLEKFKKAVAGLDKDKKIVIYCGCCSSKDCPNIGPAFEFLQVAGFTEAKILDLPVGLTEDWQNKGYPMEQ